MQQLTAIPLAPGYRSKVSVHMVTVSGERIGYKHLLFVRTKVKSFRKDDDIDDHVNEQKRKGKGVKKTASKP